LGTTRQRIVSAVAVVLSLVFGVAAMGALTLYGQSRETQRAPQEESVLHVSAIRAEPADYPVTISGFGQARALREAAVAPELSGTIDLVHPNLATGNRIQAGEVLFRIRQASYRAQVAEAQAALTQQETALARIREEEAVERARVESLDRTLQLAEDELRRSRELKDSGVGAQTGVDVAERAMVEARSQRDVAASGLDVYPLRIREAEAQLERARAQLELAELDLARTEIRAPFSGRIKSESVEAGQFIAAGTQAVVMADDSVLEIEVPIDAREARDWMRFESPGENANWFARPERVEATIRWTEGEAGTAWSGVLDRVAKYDPQSRMLHVVVQHERDGAGNSVFPLADGLFCMVEIPGRDMEDVYRVRADAVTYDNTVYVAEEERLRTRAVGLLRESGGYAYIDTGIEPGETIVTTRLVDVLENSLLDVHYDDEPPADAAAMLE